MVDQVKLSVKEGVLSVNKEGLFFKPRFAREVISVPWSNISFANTIPSINKDDGEWRTYDGKRVSPASLRGGLPVYTLEFALKDRHKLFQNCGRLTRFWLRLWLVVKHLTDGYDNPLANEGIFTFEFSKRQIKKQGEQFIDILELIRTYSRFDIICHF